MQLLHRSDSNSRPNARHVAGVPDHRVSKKQTNEGVNNVRTVTSSLHKQQPQYFNSFTHEANSDIHGHNTRSRDKLHFPKTKHDFAKINLRYRILQTINELPETVTSKVYTHSINGVTNYAKQYFISGYKKQCTIGNCYICQHTI